MKKEFVCGALFICFCVSLTACGGHTHTFSEDWSDDEAYHWHDATCGHGETSGKEKHTAVTDAAAEPTCSLTGKTEGSRCSVCGRVLVEQTEIPATGAHTFGTDNRCTECDFALEYTQTLTYNAICEEDRITGYEVSGIDGEAAELVIPAYYEGKPVTAIAEEAFYSDESITGVSVPANVKKIGSFAFAGCSALTSVALSEGLETVDTYAFYASGIESVVIPDSVSALNKGAFYQCASLASVTLGNGVEAIGDYAFYQSAVEEIVLGESIKSLGKGVFYQCASLESAVVDCAAEFGQSLFAKCSSFTTVTFGEHVKGRLSSENYMFWECAALEKVVVNTEEFTFEKYTFYQIPEGSVTIEIGDGVTRIPDGFLGASFYPKPTAVKSVKIGKNVKTIGKDAFSYCLAETFVLPEGLTEIGAGAFSDCSALKEITIPASLSKVGAGAFINTKAVERVNYSGTVNQWAAIDFGEGNTGSTPFNREGTLYIGGEAVTELVITGVETIGNYAFYGGNFTKVTIGEGVKTVGIETFGSWDTSASPDRVILEIVILSKQVNFSSYSFLNGVHSGMTKVFYYGTAEEMDENVTIGINFHRFESANKELSHYFYSETEPETEGNYWHYVNGEIVIWE